MINSLFHPIEPQESLLNKFEGREDNNSNLDQEWLKIGTATISAMDKELLVELQTVECYYMKLVLKKA
jgi:hypothetical protein